MTRSVYRPRRYGLRQRNAKTSIGEPMSQLNITPLIDVLLVLLVMIMLSIPIATHKVEVALPSVGKTSGDPPVINSLFLNKAGQTLWNGEVMDRKKLKIALGDMALDPKRPQLHLQTDSAARYEEFDHLIATIKRSGVQEIGFVGNQQYERWDEM